MSRELKLSRPLAVFDIESTGVVPQRDRIVEGFFQHSGPVEVDQRFSVPVPKRYGARTPGDEAAIDRAQAACHFTAIWEIAVEDAPCFDAGERRRAAAYHCILRHDNLRC